MLVFLTELYAPEDQDHGVPLFIFNSYIIIVHIYGVQCNACDRCTMYNSNQEGGRVFFMLFGAHY